MSLGSGSPPHSFEAEVPPETGHLLEEIVEEQHKQEERAKAMAHQHPHQPHKQEGQHQGGEPHAHAGGGTS
ncbi:chromosome segregation ATPase [Chlorella sorokiniana]|uniref:Chromosome segregation ATPase n=1 Tax=Chlorella sorokiniana TaxID=3076 RepID=A0A2P6TRZ9_CHLSO|nr:chromosome segregation ATPase [Chlorella sorokiniana]|eukprot:PRW56840.1 chromosome segregation ATPase [Chlorella sorokiniana]